VLYQPVMSSSGKGQSRVDRLEDLEARGNTPQVPDA